MGFVVNFIRFPAMQKNWKSFKIWRSYRELPGGNFFETQCSVVLMLFYDRWYNLDTTTKQVVMVWACVAKKDWLGEEMYGVWGGGSRPRGGPKRTWREVVQKDCHARNLKREDAMHRSRWKKLIKIGWWSGWWVGECFFLYQLSCVVLDKWLLLLL